MQHHYVSQQLRPSLAALLCCACLLPACSEIEADVPPDVYLIVVDTLRADRMGCYGYDRDTTPYLDSLAARGTLFLDNTAQSSWTKPSMVSLFSGQYITNFRDLLPEDSPSLAETLDGAGYLTIGIVGNVLLPTRLGFDRGFDHYDARELTEDERAARVAKGMHSIPCRELDQLRISLESELDREFARRDAGEHRPLFAYLHAMDTHAPYERRADVLRELPTDGVTVQLPGDWHNDKALQLGLDASAPESRKSWHLVNTQRGLYDVELRYTDDQLRLFFERLEREGRLENAVVVVVADHGENLWEHLEMKRTTKLRELPLEKVFQQEHGRNLSRPLLATPFLLWGKGIPQGQRIEQSVENLDLYPTLLELAGIPAVDGLQGRSLVPLLSGTGEDWQRDMHAFTLYATSIRERGTGLKLVLPSEAGLQFDATPGLFDTLVDPREHHNLYASRHDDVARLARKIDQWRRAFPTTATAEFPDDPDLLRHMRALGYIGDEAE